MRLTNAVTILAAISLIVAYAYRLPHELSLDGPTVDEKLVLAGDLPSMNAALDAGANLQGGPNVYFPPLIYAIERHFDDGVELLLARGADPDGAGGLHPLLFAITLPNQQAVDILLRHGADPDIRDRHGRTALHLLASRTYVDPQLTRFFLTAGATPDLTDRDGNTPLLIACINHNQQVQCVLLQAGADPLRKNRSGQCAADFVSDRLWLSGLH